VTEFLTGRTHRTSRPQILDGVTQGAC
jgi:hypothetical protein